jgi:hypothetical protein
MVAGKRPAHGLSVERLVMDMQDARPSGRPERNRSNELASDHLLDEVVDLLTVRDASERGVLPADDTPECNMTVARKRA